MMCGGNTAGRQASEEEVAICNAHKADVEGSLGKTFSVWSVNEVTTQVVAGTNYQFSVKVSDEGHCVYMKVFEPLPHTGNPTSLSESREEAVGYKL